MPRTDHPIPTNILEILRSHAQIDGQNLKVVKPLDSADYRGVKKFLELNGGKWNQRAKAHVFPIGGIERMIASLEPPRFHVLKNEAARRLAAL